MLEYLDYPSLVKVPVQNPAWVRVIGRDLASLAKQLGTLACQQLTQREEEVFYASYWNRQLSNYFTTYAKVRVRSIKEWVPYQQLRERMRPEQWAQRCRVHENEMQEFRERYGQHPPWISGLRGFDIWYHYERGEPGSPSNSQIRRFMVMLEEREYLKEAELYAMWGDKIEETVKQLDCIADCANRLGLPRPH
jgi:hypothetical protein